MDIILQQDVPNLGNKDELVTVKNGYARNFLIPKKLGVIATPGVKKMHEEIVRQKAHKEQKAREEAEKMAESLKGMELQIGAKTSSKGKIFGSVTNIQIAEELNKKGYNIERKNITINEDSVKEVGKYSAKVKLYKDIGVEISFEISAE
ncbi:MAG: 50S ribosomal protein L9 [Bacteroidota bacterium]